MNVNDNGTPQGFTMKTNNKMFNVQYSMFNFHVMSRIVVVQECDATDDDSSNKAGFIE